VRAPHTQLSDRGLPAVNFLSPSVFEAIATRSLRRRFVTAGCALSLSLGAGWAMQLMRVNQAEKVLTIAQVEGARLTSQVHALAPVRAYVAAVAKRDHTVQTTMAKEVQVSRVLDGLRAEAPGGVNIETATITVVSSDIAGGVGAPPKAAIVGGANACPGPDPFRTRPAAGCINLTGTADNRSAAGDFVIKLGASSLFVEPFISTTTTAAPTTAASATAAPTTAASATAGPATATSRDSVTFTGSVSISPKALSRRYVDLDRLPASGGNR
jgi:hypothetical protein